MRGKITYFDSKGISLHDLVNTGINKSMDSDLLIKKNNEDNNEKMIEDLQTILNVMEDQEIIKFMLDKGYYYFDSLCFPVNDFIFVRKESALFSRLAVPPHAMNRTSVCRYKPINIDGHSSANGLDVLRDRHHYPHLKYKTVL